MPLDRLWAQEACPCASWCCMSRRGGRLLCHHTVQMSTCHSSNPHNLCQVPPMKLLPPCPALRLLSSLPPSFVNFFVCHPFLCPSIFCPCCHPSHSLPDPEGLSEISACLYGHADFWCCVEEQTRPFLRENWFSRFWRSFPCKAIPIRHVSHMFFIVFFCDGMRWVFGSVVHGSTWNM